MFLFLFNELKFLFIYIKIYKSCWILCLLNMFYSCVVFDSIGGFFGLFFFGGGGGVGKFKCIIDFCNIDIKCLNVLIRILFYCFFVLFCIGFYFFFYVLFS